jgi:hypothetical protein
MSDKVNLKKVAEVQFDNEAIDLVFLRLAIRFLHVVHKEVVYTLHNRSEAPRQRLSSRGAEQDSGGDPSDPGDEQISIRYIPENPVEAVVRQIWLHGYGGRTTMAR